MLICLILFLTHCSLFPSYGRHVNVHTTLPHPFHLIHPTKILFPFSVKVHKKGLLKSDICGKLPAHHPIRFSSAFLPSNGFIPAPQNGFLAFDLYSSPTGPLIAEKHAESTLMLKKHRLTAFFQYQTNTLWQLSICTKEREIFRRSNKTQSIPLGPETRVAIYDIVPKREVGKPCGWMIYTNKSIRLCIPYEHNNSIHIWSEGLSIIPTKKGFIAHLNNDGSIDIWQEIPIATKKNAPLKIIHIPAIIRIYPHNEKKPSAILIEPPNDINLWPKEAQEHFSATQMFIAGTLFSLPLLKEHAIRTLTLNTQTFEKEKKLLLSLWEHPQKTVTWLTQQKKPYWLPRPIQHSV